VGEDHRAEHADSGDTLYENGYTLLVGPLLPIEDFSVEKDYANLPDNDKSDDFCDAWQSPIDRILLFSTSK